MADSKQTTSNEGTLDPWDVALFGGAAASMYRSVPPARTESKPVETPSIQKTEPAPVVPISNAGIPKDFTEARYDLPIPTTQAPVQIPITTTTETAPPKTASPWVDASSLTIPQKPSITEEATEIPPEKISITSAPPPVAKEQPALPKKPEGLLVSPYPVAASPKAITQKVPTAFLALAVAVPIFVLGFYAADYAKRVFTAQQNSDLPTPMTASIENLIPGSNR